MVSLPELDNRLIHWLEIWYGDSAWKTGGPHALLPTRERPQITLIFDKYKIKKNYIGKIVLRQTAV
jgi:hypothetical protein